MDGSAEYCKAGPGEVGNLFEGWMETNRDGERLRNRRAYERSNRPLPSARVRARVKGMAAPPLRPTGRIPRGHGARTFTRVCEALAVEWTERTLT